MLLRRWLGITCRLLHHHRLTLHRRDFRWLTLHLHWLTLHLHHLHLNLHCLLLFLRLSFLFLLFLLFFFLIAFLDKAAYDTPESDANCDPDCKGYNPDTNDPTDCNGSHTSSSLAKCFKARFTVLITSPRFVVVSCLIGLTIVVLPISGVVVRPICLPVLVFTDEIVEISSFGALFGNTLNGYCTAAFTVIFWALVV